MGRSELSQQMRKKDRKERKKRQNDTVVLSVGAQIQSINLNITTTKQTINPDYHFRKNNPNCFD